MTDWTLIAKANGLDPNEPQVRMHVATMTQLESILDGLKKNLPSDAEPAPAFAAIVTRLERAD